jgi:transcriptional regulator with XRE-family HTH domain
MMSQNIKADKTIGGNIRKWRTAKGMTQEQFSAQLQVRGCDISRGTLAKIEVGIRHISVEELNAIKTVLHVTYENLLS